MAVKRGKHGGISSKNKDWRSYYGADAYDSYVKNLKDSDRKRIDDQAKLKAESDAFNKSILNKQLYKRDKNGKLIADSLDVLSITKMNMETYDKFISSLTQEDLKVLDDIASEIQANNAESEYVMENECDAYDYNGDYDW